MNTSNSPTPWDLPFPTAHSREAKNDLSSHTLRQGLRWLKFMGNGTDFQYWASCEVKEQCWDKEQMHKLYSSVLLDIKDGHLYLFGLEDA